MFKFDDGLSFCIIIKKKEKGKNMRVGIPVEQNIYENRVALSPYGVQILRKQGHIVYVTSQAGEKSGYLDTHYERAGAKIVPENSVLYENSNLIIKVNPPEDNELKFIKKDHIITSFMNLLMNTERALKLAKTGATYIGYESIRSGNEFPIVESMSRIAGKMAFSIGTEMLSKVNKGKGILLGGSPSASRSKVVVIGGGHAGTELMKIANNVGSRVSVFDSDITKLNNISKDYPSVETFYPYHELIMKQLEHADLVVGATFAHKKKVNKLISREMIGVMEPYSVIIDLAISSGGVFETSKETNLGSPFYAINNIYHYCVPNIPSCVPRTAANALSTSILPYVIQITEGLMEESFQIRDAIQIQDHVVADFIPMKKANTGNEKEEKINSLIKKLNHNDDFDDFDDFSNIDDEDLK